MSAEEQVMLSFRVEKSVVDALDAVAARLAAEQFSARPNRTAALRYLVALDSQGVAPTQKKKKNPGN